MAAIPVTAAKPHTSLLSFRIKTNELRWGDGSVKYTHRIVILHKGKTVGCEESDGTRFASRKEASRAAMKRIRRLRKSRLFIIPVTAKHIRDGHARNCSLCAISQALWHAQEIMGLPRHLWNFRTETYAAFADSDGLKLEHRYSDMPDFHIPVDRLPHLITHFKDKTGKPLWYSEDMVEWTQQFDDWEESQHMTKAEYRETTGNEDIPKRPSPAWFILNLDDFQPL